MARRMFHSDVTESDSFLDLPFSAQALYLHLGMSADDDGFVNAPRRIVRLTGTTVDDLKILVDKRFLLEFPDGVIVLKHWRLANTLKNDRFKPLRYPAHAAKIYIKENRIYTDHPIPGAVTLLERRASEVDSKRIPSGFQVDSQPKGTKEKRTEPKIAEVEAGGFQADEGFSTGLSTPEELAAAAEDRKMKLFGGELGKGVVFLSSEQIKSLLDKLGLDAFDYYVGKLADFIVKNGAKVKNHYSTILKWAEEDSGV